MLLDDALSRALGIPRRLIHQAWTPGWTRQGQGDASRASVAHLRAGEEPSCSVWLPSPLWSWLVALAAVLGAPAPAAGAAAGGCRAGRHLDDVRRPGAGLPRPAVRLGCRCRSTTPTRPAPQIRLALTRAAAHRLAVPAASCSSTPVAPEAPGCRLPSLSDYVPGGVGSSVRLDRLRPARCRRELPVAALLAPLLRLRPAELRAAGGLDLPLLAGHEPQLLGRLRQHRRQARAAAAPDHARHRARHGARSGRRSGVDKIGFYGFSYGTYLGQVYATRYPQRGSAASCSTAWSTRSASGTPPTSTRTAASDRNMNLFWRYLASHPRAFHLGKRWRAVKRGYYRQLRRARPPARWPGAGSVPTSSPTRCSTPAYYVYDWVDAGLRLLRPRAPPPGRRPGRALPRRQHGRRQRASRSTTPCSARDAPWPGWARTRATRWAVHRRAPFLTWGNTWYNAPCLTWQAPPPPHAGRRPAGTVTTKILLINETRDAATPYAGALAVRRLFPSPRSSPASAAPRTRARCPGCRASTTPSRPT